MTFNPDIDPKVWKAEKEAYKRTIQYQVELIEHEKKQHTKYQKLYFSMKDEYEDLQILHDLLIKDYDKLLKILSETRQELQLAKEDIDASH